jgi:hypothetical protein
MNSSLKKSLSLLVVFAVLVGTIAAGTVTGVAAPAQSNASTESAQLQSALGNRPNPVVVVPGLGMSDCSLFDDEGNQIPNDGASGDVWRVLNLDTNEILADIWKLVPKALLSLLFQRDMGLSDVIRDYLPGMFIYSAHDNTGKPVKNVRAIERNYPLSQYNEEDTRDFFNMMPMQDYVDLIGADRIYCFNFPPFSNTYDHAARLDAFVQMVKAQTGATQVNLVPLSLGSTVTNAYFDMYADKHDVSKVVRVVGSTNGSLVFADLVGQNYSVNSARLFYRDIAPQLMDGYQGYLLNLAIRILPKKVLNQVLDAAFEVIQQDFFMNIPSMWATVPAERYEEYANKLISDPEHAVLRAQTDRYYNYQRNLEANTAALIEDGIQIYNICGYGFNFGHGWGDYQYFQFFKCADDINSDGIIQVSSTAMGAYSAAPGTTFPADYVQQNTHCTNPAHNHISPDRTVDASTCYLPDQTWFFYGQHHEIANNDVAVHLACVLMGTDTITSVYSDPDFPQFNGSRYTKRIKNDLIPAVTQALTRTDLSAADMAELNAALAEANTMLASTVANDAQTDAIEARLRAILVKIGVYGAPVPPKSSDVMLEKTFKLISDRLWDKYGPTGYSEIIKIKLDDTAKLLQKLLGLL